MHENAPPPPTPPKAPKFRVQYPPLHTCSLMQPDPVESEQLQPQPFREGEQARTAQEQARPEPNADIAT